MLTSGSGSAFDVVLDIATTMTVIYYMWSFPAWRVSQGTLEVSTLSILAIIVGSAAVGYWRCGRQQRESLAGVASKIAVPVEG